eukprot:764292-Hanusia_phi.AAC.3
MLGGMPKYIDFGLSKEKEWIAASSRASTQVAGTHAWMAPEKKAGGASSSASDVYSLGLVMMKGEGDETRWGRRVGLDQESDCKLQARGGTGRCWAAFWQSTGARRWTGKLSGQCCPDSRVTMEAMKGKQCQTPGSRIKTGTKERRRSQRQHTRLGRGQPHQGNGEALKRPLLPAFIVELPVSFTVPRASLIKGVNPLS